MSDKPLWLRRSVLVIAAPFVYIAILGLALWEAFCEVNHSGWWKAVKDEWRGK